MLKLFVAILFLLQGAYSLPAEARKDYYPDFKSLAADPYLVSGKDYRVDFKERSSSQVLSFAIHGGLIEPLTDPLAEAFADAFQTHFYAFRSFSKGPSNQPPIGMSALHVTATHYNDERLLGLLARSRRCVAFHGVKLNVKGLCVGGRSKALRRKFANVLESTGLARDLGLLVDANGNGEGWTRKECRIFSGTHPQNVVNRCGEGLQLEMSWALLQQLNDPSEGALKSRFLNALWGVLQGE